MTNSQPYALAVDNITFRYPGGAPVFSHFSFHARQEFVVLLGPSGCGKSTLLNLLAGFTEPERGAVRIGGERTTPENHRLGYVFQQPQLFGWLTALENVRFGLRMQRREDVASQRRRAMTYLQRVGWYMPHISCRTRCPGACSSACHWLARWRWSRMFC